jgi:hypothetical protein
MNSVSMIPDILAISVPLYGSLYTKSKVPSLSCVSFHPYHVPSGPTNRLPAPGIALLYP